MREGHRPGPLGPGGGKRMAATQVRCGQCEKSLDDARLYKCPICFKYVCDEHVHRVSGREFCSAGCAQYFFFGDDEE